MNVLQHIQAGHYPKDDKGRALVPTGHTFGDAVICATDKPGPYPILGWLPTAARVATIEFSWDENGYAAGRQEIERLHPPPPRKVPVKAWAIIGPGGELARLRDTPPAGVAAGIERIVELTGEYTEAWP